jgi:hypothetical protein
MTTPSDLLYVALFAVAFPVWDYLVSWPAFQRRSQADPARARMRLWRLTIGLAWPFVTVGAARPYAAGRGYDVASGDDCSNGVPMSRHVSFVAALLILTGCGWGSHSTQLRITNVGSAPIRNLTVLFPEDQVAFGDIAVGETSPYREVAHGVYSYAAYRLEVDGGLVTQPVIDWVGEVPMDGESFTYALLVDSHRVDLVSVTRDD